jgi:hypothetical protein
METNRALFGFPQIVGRQLSATGVSAVAVGLTEYSGVFGMRMATIGRGLSATRIVVAMQAGGLYFGGAAIATSVGVSIGASILVQGALQAGIGLGSFGTALGSC